MDVGRSWHLHTSFRSSPPAAELDWIDKSEGGGGYSVTMVAHTVMHGRNGTIFNI